MHPATTRSHKGGVASKPYENGMAAFSDANSQLVTTPWRSPAVLSLASKVGQGSDVQPMLIEAPTGTILAAVGEERDHKIATRAMVEARTRGRSAAPGPDDTRGLARPARGGGGGGAAGAVAFGAVYEHRDCFGAPRFVGETAALPEMQARIDCAAHPQVRALLLGGGGGGGGPAAAAGQRRRRGSAGGRPSTSRVFDGVSPAGGGDGGGSTAVVWAAVGRGPVGPAEMAAMRRAVQEDRAARQRAAKLGGIKPYSRHGFGDV